MSDAWFDPNTFGAYYGAIGGGGTGLLGGIVGTLCGILIPKGKGRRLIMRLMIGAVVLGVVQLIFGVAALILGQPYGIWYPPTLCGFISAVVFGAGIPVIRRRYE